MAYALSDVLGGDLFTGIPNQSRRLICCHPTGCSNARRVIQEISLFQRNEVTVNRSFFTGMRICRPIEFCSIQPGFNFCFGHRGGNLLLVRLTVELRVLYRARVEC